MFLTNSSHRKAKRGPLPQPVVSALRILFLVSNNVLQKEKKQILKEMDHFCHGRKKMFIVYQSASFGKYDIHPSPSLPIARQSSAGGKLHNERHNKTCLHMQRTLRTLVCCWVKEGVLCLSRGKSKDTEGKVRNANRTHQPLTGLSSSRPAEPLHLVLT